MTEFDNESPQFESQLDSAQDHEGETQVAQPGLVRRVGHLVKEVLLEIIQTLLPALVIALLLNHFVAQSTYVSGQSMEPSLHSDQRLIIEKVSYHLRTPERGDIVVIDVDHSEIPLIKRVIGLPGEVVEVQDNHVYINGELLAEPYVVTRFQRNYGPIEVPERHVFVMGDNRNNSNDSRYFGAVSLDQVLGRAWVSYWPPEDIGVVN
jgi:signal peptidase I